VGFFAHRVSSSPAMSLGRNQNLYTRHTLKRWWPPHTVRRINSPIQTSPLICRSPLMPVPHAGRAALHHLPMMTAPLRLQEREEERRIVAITTRC